MFASSQKRSRQDDDQENLPDNTLPKRPRMNNPSSEPTAAPISSRNQATSPSSSSSAETNGKNANHDRARTSNTQYPHRFIARQRNTQESSDATSPSSSEESTSSEGTSSDEDDDPDSDEDANVNGSDGEPSLPQIPGRQKPRIHRVEKNSDILSRVSAFLPQMKDANESLEREIAAGRGKDLRLDDVDDEHEGRYIEMVLYIFILYLPYVAELWMLTFPNRIWDWVS